MNTTSNDGDGGSVEVTPSMAARVLGVLLLTPDDDLEGFRRRMLGKASTLDADQLRAVQAMLQALGSVLFTEDEQSWQRVLDARDKLCQDRQADTWGETAGPKRGRGKPDESEAKPIAGKGPESVSASASPPGSAAGPPPMGAPAPPPSLGDAPAPSGAAAAPPIVPATGPWASSRPASATPPTGQLPPRPPPPPPRRHPATGPASGMPASPWARARAPGAGSSEAEETEVRSTPQTAGAAGSEPLPFKGKVEAPPPAADQLQEEAEDENDVDFGRTVPTDGMTSPFLKRGVLPFTPEEDAAARPTSTSAPASAESAVSSGPEAGVAATSEIPSGVPNLTVEQYASLHACCSEQPERAEVTHQEYGLPNAKTREELDAHWGRRLDADPDLREQFDKLVEQYRHWYRQQQRS